MAHEDDSGLTVEDLFGPEYVAATQAKQAKAVLAEIARRRVEALRLYEPLVEQAKFHASAARTRLLRGSNRGGKTLPAAVEVARAVCGMDPHGKYPAKDGRAFIVGKDLGHVGQVLWKKLGRPGAFRMIRDKLTDQWRAFRPWSPEDLRRQEASKPAPPLVPPRLVKEIAWENKKEGVPGLVRLHNGWELSFFSSLGKPPQGSDIDLWWFDEEIVDPEWFQEIVARVLDRRGRGFWSATPQAGTDQLFELHERAEALRGKPNAAVEEFVILLADNPHIPDDMKREFVANLSDEEAAVRVGGEFAVVSFKVYPNFSMPVHGVERFEIPSHWTRYMVVDPGFQVCACLFAAVPPPHEGDAVYLYDELYLHNCDAQKFAEAVRQKTQGAFFQTFLIDPHMAVHSELGTGRTVASQYSTALQAQNVRSVQTGSDFLHGCDDVKGGILAVQGWLRVRQDGTTKLRVFKGTLNNLEREFKFYRKKRDRQGVTDTPVQRNNHLMDTLRYLALHDPRYVKPPVHRREAGVVKALREKRERQKRKDGGGYVNLGPGKSHARV